jgi:hypothetical protein
MEAKRVEILLAGIEDAQEIIPLMAAFNEGEGIVWRPASMIAALRRLLRESDLGWFATVER